MLKLQILDANEQADKNKWNPPTQALVQKVIPTSLSPLISLLKKKSTTPILK